MRDRRSKPSDGDKNPHPGEELLTVQQVSENWQVSQRTIRRMIADGRLPIIRLGRAIRIAPKGPGLEEA